MPLIRPKGPGGDEGAQRTTFRPPWVKDGPPALPMPSAPWIPKRRESQTQQPVQNKVNIYISELLYINTKREKNIELKIILKTFFIQKD